MKKKFLVPSLLMAGFLGNGAQALVPVPPSASGNTDPDKGLFAKFRQTHVFTLAGHSSHRSHSSHASHSSHRSSTGGYSYTSPLRVAPQPLYTNPGANSYAAPDPAPKPLPGNSAKFRRIAIEVQTALQAYGFYDGPIDGVIGKASRDALARFQSQYNLEVTGTITPQVLDAFGISAR